MEWWTRWINTNVGTVSLLKEPQTKGSGSFMNPEIRERVRREG